MNIDINIFILCHNEQLLLPFTVGHYKQLFPNCAITIYDNESTDNSVEIAKELGCHVISWSSNNQNNVRMKLDISNNCWKTVKSGWIISIDMDEWLCITEETLRQEQLKGTTILFTQGLEMIGESNSAILDDIDLYKINRGIFFDPESKCVCFFRPSIKEMNYSVGCHKCDPVGKIRFSSKKYIIKHMSYLGLPFFEHKMVSRCERSLKIREKNPEYSSHYNADYKYIESIYRNKLFSSFYINELYNSTLFCIETVHIPNNYINYD